LRFVILTALCALVLAAPLASPAHGEVAAAADQICPLLPGEPPPAGLTALDVDGRTFDLSKALGEQPSVLIFFRGGW
jgi:hypothetical protein